METNFSRVSFFVNVFSTFTSLCVCTLDLLSQAIFSAQERAQSFVSDKEMHRKQHMLKSYKASGHCHKRRWTFFAWKHMWQSPIHLLWHCIHAWDKGQGDNLAVVFVVCPWRWLHSARAGTRLGTSRLHWCASKCCEDPEPLLYIITTHEVELPANLRSQNHSLSQCRLKVGAFNPCRVLSCFSSRLFLVLFLFWVFTGDPHERILN